MSEKETVEIETETSSAELGEALNAAVALYVDRQPKGTDPKIVQAGAFGVQAGFGAALLSVGFEPQVAMDVYDIAKSMAEGDCDCDNCTKKQEESKECKEK
jgi:hypothetical protein